ncbi:MAG: hypothetical protein OHK0024_28220 [Thalassobaculales bacterium]
MLGSAMLRLAVLLPLATLLALPTPALAQRITLAQVDDAGASVALEQPQPIALHPGRDDLEVLLRFGGPLPPGALAELPQRLPGWIATVSAGYDAALLRLARPARVTLAGDTLRLEAATATARPAAETAEELRLKVLAARARALSGDPAGARMELLALESASGGDPDVRLALAEVEERLGAWRRAIALYDKVAAERPQEPEAAEQSQRLRREYGPQARVEVDHQRAARADEQWIAVTRLRQDAGPDAQISFTGEARRVQDNEVRRANGALTSETGNFQRGEIAYARQLDEGELRLALLPGPESLGGSLGYRFDLGGGASRLAATYRAPYWDLVEGIVEGGTKDSLEAAHERQIGPDLLSSLTLRASRYGVAGDEDVAGSVGFLAGLRWILAQEGPYASLGYTIDGEYMGHVDQRRDAAGNAYQPLALGSRELHAIDLALSDQVEDWLRYEAYAGWAYDRLGADGPFAGLTLAHPFSADLEFGLRTSYAKVSGQREGNTVTRGGGYLLWRF